jgi:hypothetical protein
MLCRAMVVRLPPCLRREKAVRFLPQPLLLFSLCSFFIFHLSLSIVQSSFDVILVAQRDVLDKMIFFCLIRDFELDVVMIIQTIGLLSQFSVNHYTSNFEHGFAREMELLSETDKISISIRHLLCLSYFLHNCHFTIQNQHQ